MTVRGAMAFVSLLALVACDNASTTSAASTAATGSLSGKAVYAGQSDHSGISISAGGSSTTTDAGGDYSFSSLPVGQYQITAIAPRSIERALVVSASVSSGANTAAPDLVFTPAIALAGQLTLMGEPLPGAAVSLDGAASTTTDVNGIYSFDAVRPGVHSLSFTSGDNSDGIPTVLYSPDTGASVPAPYSYQQLFQLQPFDLQVARRLASVNIKVPSRTITLAPTLSPDGLLYFYGLSNDEKSTDVYVGATAGGAPVLVSDSAYAGYAPKFSPGSDYLAFIRRNATVTPERYELYAVRISAGPSAGAAKLLSSTSAGMEPGAWDFSPQTTTPPSLYFVEQGSLREVTAEAGPLNMWPGVSSFWLSTKQKRIVFRQASGTTNRLVSVPADGSTSPPLFTFESTGASGMAVAVNSFQLSPDESDFAWAVSSTTGVSAGLKIAATNGAHGPTVLSADTSFSCMSFTPDGTRVAWDRGGVNGLWTSLVAGGTPVSYGATAARPSTFYYGSAVPCPTFTDDGQVWLAYGEGSPAHYKLALQSADGSGTLTPFYTDPNPYSPVASPDSPQTVMVQFSRKAAVYGQMNTTTSTTTLWSKGLTTAPATFDATQYYYYLQMVLPMNGSTAIYYKYETGSFNAFWVDLATATSPSRVGVNCSYSATKLSPDESKALIECTAQSSGAVAATVDLATGARKSLMGRASPGKANLQQVGTATKFVGFRQNTPGPYEFQDGVYIADP